MKQREGEITAQEPAEVIFPLVGEASKEGERIIIKPQAQGVYGPAFFPSDPERKLDGDIPEDLELTGWKEKERWKCPAPNDPDEVRREKESENPREADKTNKPDLRIPTVQVQDEIEDVVAVRKAGRKREEGLEKQL